MVFKTGDDSRKALNKKKKLYQRKGQDSKFKDSKASMSLPPSKVNAYAVPGVPKFTHRKGSGLECTCTCKKHLRNDKQHIATLRERAVQFYKVAAKFEKAVPAHKRQEVLRVPRRCTSDLPETVCFSIRGETSSDSHDYTQRNCPGSC